MAVHLTVPDPSSLLPVKGVTLGITQAHIRKANHDDLVVMVLEPGAVVAGVFTQNRFCAAPVSVAKAHLARASLHSPIRALLINTGNANAGTGREGLLRARTTCKKLAGLMACRASQILPFSTGVIMEPLPVERVIAGLPHCLSHQTGNNWHRAAHAIMTTDTVAKAVSRQIRIDGEAVTLTGIAKGAGMIHPNMATLLSFIATDAVVSREMLKRMLRHASEESFNCITVDGDTSTNDACVLMATGRAGNAKIDRPGAAAYGILQSAIMDMAQTLAQAIVRDGEGATKFIRIQVEKGSSVAECRRIAYAIAHSPLVKTAFFASDPNLGRILAAIGSARIPDLAVNRIRLYLDDVLVAEKGGRAARYREEDGKRVMAQDEVTVRVVLNRGREHATVWTCDFSYDYVRINADYRT